MGRRRYQFKDRAEAEQAFKKAEQEAREMQWFAAALVARRVKWGRKAQGTRFGCFIPNPQLAYSEAMVVEEFAPDTRQAPTYYVYTQEAFMKREGDIYRCRAGRKDPELDAWIEGARWAQDQAKKLRDRETA